MYQKKGFSFLEVLIVIMVIGVLFVTFKGAFQIKNKDIFYGQACIESIYGEINNFLYTAMSSKAINSGGIQIFPNVYSIDFSGQHIILRYQDSGGLYTTYRDIFIEQNTDNYCNDNNYTIYMTGDAYTLYISKGLQGQQNNTFVLSGATIQYTGGNTFVQCTNESTGCQNIAYIESDTRTMSIKKQMCLLTDNTGFCQERDK